MVHPVTCHHLRLVSPRSPLHVRSAIGRSKSHRSLQIRQLWWWGRHGNHSQWTSPFDEHMEERLRRQQRIIRHQYSKMLRRRELWDRDGSSRMSWPWKLSHRWIKSRLTDAQNMSSTNTVQSKFEEQHDEDRRGESPLATFHKDFESFKKAVDKAIERDPYGTLFGRRLQSPPTNNNSSWTSFSWIFDPKEIKEEKVESAKPGLDESTKPSSSFPHNPLQNNTRPINTSPVPASQSTAAEEYEYDPISMRRVPKAKVDFNPQRYESPTIPQPVQPTETQEYGPPPPPKLPVEPPKSDTLSKPQPSASSQPSKPRSSVEAKPTVPSKQSLFQALFFSEHGVDIPVKTYKPHKVYGPKPVSQESKAESASAKKKVEFETNRKRELLALKAKTLGNTIDTTAEYGGKYTTHEDTAPNDHPRISKDHTSPSDDAPLFSGTTYEGRSHELLKTAQPMSDWLRKEGFTIEQALSKEKTDGVEIPVKKFDRSLDPDKTSSSRTRKLEPALDRQRQPGGIERSSSSRAQERDSVSETPGDLDYLRASDVRAATSAERKSKLQIENEKTETRKKLEDDFSAWQKASDTGPVFTRPDQRSVMSKSLDNVWKHVQNYPDGIVARTVKSMGVFNDNFKKYVRPEPKVNLNEKLDFPQDSLNKLSSIYKPRQKASRQISFSPSKEVLEADRMSLKRSLELREAKMATERSSQAETAKANDLAKDLKREYENTYGPISVHHRQVPDDNNQTKDVSVQVSKTQPHPLRTATVKEGVNSDPAIDSYIKFEQEYSGLVADAKVIRRELHEAHNHYRHLKERMNMKLWTEIENVKPTAKEPLLSIQPTERTSTQGLDKTVAPLLAREIKKAADPETSPVVSEEAVFTPHESAVWNDEQPPPVSELRKTYAAPFVILKYNVETDTVARLNAHFHAASQDEPLPPLQILSRLRRTEKFFPFFETLERDKYEIISSDSDTLIFRKIKDPSVVKREQQEARNIQAAQDASAQPVIQEIPGGPPKSGTDTPPPKEAATVLDEIPIEIEPVPGPSAPTAPPSTPSTKPAIQPSVSKPKVKRQENVFSGTRRTLPPTTNPIDPEIASPRSIPTQESFNDAARPSGFSRLLRTAKRVVLTVLGLSVGAYVVGVITEGINAKAQQKALANGQAGLEGPRKKIVLPGTRPGIFSTENSR